MRENEWDEWPEIKKMAEMPEKIRQWKRKWKLIDVLFGIVICGIVVTGIAISILK